MKNDVKFDFDDILIQPAEQSDVESRKNVNVFYNDGWLPLFTAPMDTVINYKNIIYFNNNKIYPILPRTEKILFPLKGEGVAIGLDAFEEFYIKRKAESLNGLVLIDIANGHMSKLFEIVKKAKEKYGDKLTLMVGNIANPKTYTLLSDTGADYIRIGIGNGGGCLTTEQTGVGYPMASLIRECYEESCKFDKPAKIVADGGFKKYSDIIKALALGADYVMLGSILNKALESCADTYTQNVKHDWGTEPGELVDQYSDTTKLMFKNGSKFFKKFRGMSTKEVQKSLGNEILKTSEGITRMNQVEYTLEGWCDNFKHYLSSAMSYTNKTSLKDFIGQVEFNMITENAFKRYNK
ncbi:MAG: guanosine 5'-monophosphate oxidoreductase [Ignavibacteria bacterium]|nr:guanosine 5'-monophosphate oxidoreductase [Ignavibacteria bacterium]